MKVILTENVKSVGNIGEVVNVSPGYARNSLIPNQLAVLADDGNTKSLKNQQRRLSKKMEEAKNEALEFKKKVDAVTIELTKVVGGNGKLFGAVTNSELSKELAKQGIDIERRLIVVEDPIKSLGTFNVPVKLFEGVAGSLTVKVSMDEKQVQELKKKQLAAEKKAKAPKKSATAEKEAKTEGGEKNEEENTEDSSPNN